jgi:hypothetical protein
MKKIVVSLFVFAVLIPCINQSISASPPIERETELNLHSFVWPAGPGERFPRDWPDDARSTTGPKAPFGVDVEGNRLLQPASSRIINNVPAYIWTDGCGPTAAGMVFGYWDGKGYPDLVSGSAASQTPAVNTMISSTQHYNDYALPLDAPPDPLQPDKSEPPIGDEHSNNCVADFMRTSQSYWFNYYGWSSFSDMDDSLIGFANYAAPAYSSTAANLTWGNFTWEMYRNEIDAGRPLIFLVDTDADGSTDHFVTAIGYSDDSGPRQYACLNTWDTTPHWYDFEQLAPGQDWGIYGATLFRVENFDSMNTHIYLPAITGDPGTYCPPIMIDDFSNPSSGWPSGSGSSGSYGYLSNEYQILITNPYWNSFVSPGVAAENFSASFDVRSQNGVYGSFGLVFGLLSDWSEFYIFTIDTLGCFRIYRYDDSSGWALIASGCSSHLKTGMQSNHIELRRSGVQMKAYANNHLLVELSDAAFTGNRMVGLGALSYGDTSVDARFDNFELYSAACP